MKTFYYLKITLLLLLAAGSCSEVRSQEKGTQEIHIGEHVPDITLRGFYGDTLKKVKLSELYRNKLLLLDFWGTWCAGCLEEMPRLIELKKEFGDQLQIVAVGYESYQKIDRLFKRRPDLNSKAYLTLTSDSILTRRLFPHKLLPHIVWIDQTGKVTMISEGTDVTSSNIRNALSNRPIAASIKQDKMNLGTSSITEPFHIMDTSFQSRSIFTRAVKGMLSFDAFLGNDAKEPRKFNRIFMGNLTIRDLYWNAVIGHWYSAQNYSRLIFEVKDSLKYMLPQLAPISFRNSSYTSFSAWADANSYCYDLKLPYRVADTILQKYMIADLNRYLNINGRYERRNMDCYVLKLARQPANQSSQGQANTLPDNANKSSNYQPINIQQLTELLNHRIGYGTIINESGISLSKIFNVNVQIKKGLTPEQINAVINPLGFSLEAGKRIIPVFVISENE
ncbi:MULTISPECIES: TlpA family protein disulfide reductase [unclassified Mucilaginibacter]|uniref:TlpA family protein disulfide reductase n=1 Tax=unclassified Mucilaginibacter TaxID=2617802 RepID=UPI00088CB209|nr:TlpA disulfide reductase family protein [Mucilaginibacter sp. OK268]SDP12738.1 Thiol-disulfide isomerase or thioredoxin [Mucilaginibacter sp. OK268]